ncbi:MAG: hypothetical protein ACHQDF_02975 [Chitinophagales bacterium]
MKRTITSAAELDEAIKELERKASHQKEELKEHFSGTMENLKPINLIKHGLQSAFSGNNKQDLLKAAIGLGSGILGRKLMMGRSGGGLIRKVIGAALEMGVVGMVVKNAEKLKEKGSDLIEKIFHKKRPSGPKPPAISNKKPANYFQKN